MPSVVVLGEELVRQMLEHPEIRNIGCFAGLSSQVVVDTDCRTCGGRSVRRRNVTPVERLKICFLSLSPDQQQLIKDRLGVLKFVVYLNDPKYPSRSVV